VEAGHGAGAYQEPTVAPAAPCLVHTPAELDVAKFPADGKNRTAAISAQGLRGCRFALVRRHGMRSGAGKPTHGRF
jgi:hypothetical protein